MKTPQTKFGQFCLMFLTEFISFFIIVINTNAYTHGSYLWTVITDTLFSLQNFVMAKLMIDNKELRGFWAGLGYTLGGTLGSCTAIFISTVLHITH